MLLDRERKYALTRLARGDYLLPGNSGHTLYRLTRSEGEGWDLLRFRDPFPLADSVDPLTVLEWGRWECVAQQLETRREAVRESVRLG